MTYNEQDNGKWIIFMFGLTVAVLMLLQSCIPQPVYTGCRRLQDCPQTPHQKKHIIEPRLAE